MELISPISLLVILMFYIIFIGIAIFLTLKYEKNNLVKVLWIIAVLFFPFLGAVIYLANFLINKKQITSS